MELQIDEDEIPMQGRSFSRSPHPYHRHNGRLDSTGSDPTTYFDIDSRKRRKTSVSPSESGTEADDERTTLLKGLPAPPLRPRKGWKAAAALGNATGSSPLLTPSYLEDSHDGHASVSAKESRQRSQVQAGTAAASPHAIEKLSRRRRDEAVRRVSESISLALVGYLSLRGSGVDLRTEVKCHFIVVAPAYIVYFIRNFWRWRQRQKSSSGELAHTVFRMPLITDPAPLLYPVFLPVFIAVSLASVNPAFMIPNVVLSICSIPSKMIMLPAIDYNQFHWIVSVIPCTIASSRYESSAGILLGDPFYGIHPEILALLYPLHQALVPTLGFLTTTSLLPAELQLLSVALINLLLFSTSPQATILKALLWIGGVTVFVLCRYILRLTVEIARIPSWRFRRSRYATRGRTTLFRAVDDSLGGILSKNYLFGVQKDSSESENEPNTEKNAARGKFLSNGVLKEPASQQGRLKVKVKVSTDRMTVDDIRYVPSDRTDGIVKSALNGIVQHRRHTLPTSLTDTLHKVGLKNYLSRSSSARPNLSRSLTNAQAIVLKWIFSIYVYLIVAGTILVPIRSYIGQRALGGSEPLGWALGYMFGDLPAFRLQTIMWDLERWICLPWRSDYQSLLVCRGEHFRRVVLGAANARLLICAYCIANITAGLMVVFRLSAVVEVDTRRKVFHGMMVAMFLPTIFIDPCFVALALALILVIFSLLDLFRASQLPPVSKPLTYFLAPYVDGRDHRGPIIVSHIFLLIGCAVPLWLSLVTTQRSGLGPFSGWDTITRDMSMISGIVCVGMGDAAASLIGRRYGRRRWPWSGGKSLEGSLAFAVAVVLGLGFGRAWLLFGGWEGDSGDSWIVTVCKAAVAAMGSSFTEAVLTGGNDNVVVPVILWLLVRGLKM